MGVKVTNNGFGTLSAGINSSATTVTVDSGQGARFPALSSGDFFFATLVDTSNNLEIIKVTARSSDSMTVLRAQDNTTARAFSVGDRFELRPTAVLFETILSEAIAGSTVAANSITTAMLQADSVTNAKIADDAIDSEHYVDGSVDAAHLASSLDLSSKTLTLNKNASSLVHLANFNQTPNSSTHQISVDHTGFESFELYIHRILGSSSSGGENLDAKFVVNGSLDNGSSTAYTVDSINLGTGAHRNQNNVDNMELFTTNGPAKGWQGRVTCINFGANQEVGFPNMTCSLSSTTVTFTSSNTYILSRNHRVTAIRFAFTAGNITVFKADLYGVKT